MSVEAIAWSSIVSSTFTIIVISLLKEFIGHSHDCLSSWSALARRLTNPCYIQHLWLFGYSLIHVSAECRTPTGTLNHTLYLLRWIQHTIPTHATPTTTHKRSASCYSKAQWELSHGLFTGCTLALDALGERLRTRVLSSSFRTATSSRRAIAVCQCVIRSKNFQ